MVTSRSMDRREFLKLSGAIGVSLASLPLGEFARADAAPSKPNILVFLTDDHGQWAQHAYGNAELKTPNLDALAARGVRMTNCFTPCPVCSPARASFYTGRMPSQHGIHDWIEEAVEAYKHPGLNGQTLISELLQAAGYHTGLVGKWHCGREREPQRGFDRWFSYWVNQYPHLGVQNFSDQGKHVVENGPQSPLLTDRAIDFLHDHHANGSTSAKPFFLVVGYVDTHSPHKDAPPELVEQYQSATFSDIPDEHFSAAHGKIREGKAATPKAENARLAEYYGAVSSIDREIGRILDELKSTGQLDNTLIVYTGDHGLNCGHHGIWEKGNGTLPQNFLDESIRIACSVSWPAGGILQNTTCGDFVNHTDLWATLLDIAGSTPDAKVMAELNSPGKSYLPQLRGKAAEKWSDAQFSEYGNARMVRTAEHKLILRYAYADKLYPSEFYDLESDPRETINGYADPKNAAIVQRLTARIDEFFGKYSVAGHDGLHLAEQPPCNAGSPWMLPMPVKKP